MNPKIIFALFASLAGGMFILPGNLKAQSYNNDDPDNMNTITIHITKEVDGNVVQIDTTIITDGAFDADAFLKEKGILNDINIEKDDSDIAIHHPRPIFFNHDDPNIFFNDTLSVDSDMNITIDEDQIIKQFRNMPFAFTPMEIPQFDDIPELKDLNMQHFWGNVPGMSGFGNGLPVNLEKMVVKKKRHGKKVILFFGDEKDKPVRKRQKHTRVYNFDINSDNPTEKQTFITPEKQQRIIIKEEKSGKNLPGKQKKVVIIKQEQAK